MRPFMVFNRTLHREMWEWLADNPGETKAGWIHRQGFSHDVRKELSANDYSFACAACARVGIARRSGENSCSGRCPLDWRAPYCFSIGAAYDAWRLEAEAYCDGAQNGHIDPDIIEGLTDFAGEIANLPVREPEGYCLIIV